MRKYISATEAARKLKKSRAWIKRLAFNHRIEGAIKVGNQWAIPSPVRIIPAQK